MMYTLYVILSLVVHYTVVRRPKRPVRSLDFCLQFHSLATSYPSYKKVAMDIEVAI